MRFTNKMLKLYAITDQQWSKDQTLAQQVEQAILGGVTMIQLREKNRSFDDCVSIAKEIKTITDKYKVPLIINDSVAVALAINADGVHIGQDDMPVDAVRQIIGPDKILGVSVHNYEEALHAFQSKADYLGVGAIFETTTKKDAKLVDMQTLKEITNNLSIPSVAIGGIKKDNIQMLKDTNIAGVAIVSDIFAAKNIVEQTKELKQEIDKYIK